MNRQQWLGTTLLVFGTATSLAALAPDPQTQAASSPANGEVSTEEPRLEVVQLGELQPDELAFSSVRIPNDGSEVWTIARANVDCGCVHLGEYEREIQPGGFVDLPITVNPEGKRRPEIEQTVTVILEPGQRRRTIQVVGTILVPPRISEEFIAVPVEPGQARWQHVNHVFTPAGFRVEVSQRPESVSVEVGEPEDLGDGTVRFPVAVSGTCSDLEERELEVAFEATGELDSEAPRPEVRARYVLSELPLVEAEPSLLLLSKSDPKLAEVHLYGALGDLTGESVEAVASEGIEARLSHDATRLFVRTVGVDASRGSGSIRLVREDVVLLELPVLFLDAREG